MFQIPDSDSDAKTFVKAKQRNQPTFTVVAQDELAPYAILAWISAARAAGVNAAKIEDAEKDYREMVQWQQENSGKVKLPD